MQRREIEIVGADPVNRRQLTMQYVIGAAVRGTAFESDQVRHVLYDADDTAIPLFVGADGAEFAFREVATTCAPLHGLSRFPQCVNQRRQSLWFFDEQVQGDSLGGSEAQPRELLQ